MRLIVTLFVLAFTQLFFNVAEAAPHSHINANGHKNSKKVAIDDSRRKRKPVKTAARRNKHTQPHKVQRIAQLHSKSKSKTTKLRSTTRVAANKKYYANRKLLARRTLRTNDANPIASALNSAHSQKYQKARQTAMNKLMNQIGKPYQWGGTSPHTGFDCSGLVYYAYKDLVKFKIPRTANEMYHLRDAAPVKRAALQKGDLVFFRIHRRGAADHVGVYVGNGKFIQSPRTGKDIQISELSGDYWQRHYIGARRVMTPNTVR